MFLLAVAVTFVTLRVLSVILITEYAAGTCYARSYGRSTVKCYVIVTPQARKITPVDRFVSCLAYVITRFVTDLVHYRARC